MEAHGTTTDGTPGGRIARTSAESIREEVEPFRAMTPGERLIWFVRLQRSMDALVVLRQGDAAREDAADHDFWRHWRDPAYGRPR